MGHERSVLALMLILAAAPASAEETITIFATSPNCVACSNTSPWTTTTNTDTITIDVEKQDLVIVRGSDVTLLRQVFACPSVVDAIRPSPDVTHARCFK